MLALLPVLVPYLILLNRLFVGLRLGTGGCGNLPLQDQAIWYQECLEKISTFFTL